ncbi:thioredoxin domain-containing protein [Microbulbifer thermotolerans]|uniref:thioredoxin domain-containing protein n=1 Tax=Microbulbifer thermotolerans TaxID=252514 RepID=UPI00224ADC71|nr:thioredoxin domain-containing protein [Microbulbifer thermotolerans]MCX2836222.1 thioredoxin domain-containing protein [Microbulbifer thermotolerans]
MINLKVTLWWPLFFLFVLCFSACSKSHNKAAVQDDTTGQDVVVARTATREITAAELDDALKLELHDLAVAAYQLRLKGISEILHRSGGESEGALEIFLSPPQPPRIVLPENSRTPRGNPEAPVTIAVFCSYQSPHCKSIQPVLRQLTTDYAGWVKLVLYDLPLKFHREGISAAVAARCAEAQGTLWSYQDGLYAYLGELGTKAYRQLAIQTGLDLEAFQGCLREKLQRDQVRTDMQFASEVGLRKVPIVFINGLYIKGLQPYEHYAYWVKEELSRLGVNDGQQHPWALQRDENLPPTALPLTLVGVSLSEIKENSHALIQVEAERAQKYREGDTIVPGVSLQGISRAYVLLDNRGATEKLVLRGKAGDRVPLTLTRARDEETRRRIEQPMGESGRKLIEPSAVLPLGQKWLEEQLQNRAELEKKFVAAELEVEGHQLLRLEGIADNEFFTALGFQDKDVLLRVNDTWVHSGQNSLWDALTSGEIVDVVFMRNGLPHRLQYVVEERGYFEKEGADNGGDEEGNSED